MPLIFPAAPTVGQTYVSGGTTWSWDGTSWTSSGTGSDKVSKSGDTMTGALVLPAADPTLDDHAARKLFAERVAGRKVIVSGATPTSIANGTITTLSWSTEVVDEAGAWNSGQSGRFTTPAWATRVLIGFSVRWGAGSTQSRIAIIQKNGSGTLHRDDRFATGLGAQTVVMMDTCVGGDYYQAQVFQDTGANFALDGGTGTRFWAVFYA